MYAILHQQVACVACRLSCLLINDIDAGIGVFANTQRTVRLATTCKLAFVTELTVCCSHLLAALHAKERTHIHVGLAHRKLARQVNTQMVVGTLMNLADEPNVVSTGQNWRSQVRFCC